MATFSHISGAEPSTITFKAATVTQTRNSSVMHQEIISLGDPDSSAAIAAVLNTAPASTAWGLVTREVAPVTKLESTCIQGTNPWVVAFPAAYISSGAQSGNSSGLTVRPVWSSTAADQPVRAVLSSTGADNPVTVSALPANSSLVQLNVIAAGYISSGVAAGNSSALTVRNVWSSTSADQPVRAAQGVGNSSGADAWPTLTVDSSNAIVKPGDSANNALRVNVVAGAAGGSTIMTVSALPLISSAVAAGNSSALTVRNVWSSTNTDQPVSARCFQSTAADLNVTVANFSTGVLATIGTHIQSTVAPSSGSSGIVVRQVVDAQTAFASTSALASTTVEVASSVANIRIYVTAYSITSTNQTPAQWGFFSSNGTLLWPITLAALSSATCGANLAVSQPGYIFRTAASDALNFKTAGSTVSAVQLGVSYYKAP